MDGLISVNVNEALVILSCLVAVIAVVGYVMLEASDPKKER